MKITSYITLEEFEAWGGGKTTLDTLKELCTSEELDGLGDYIVECLLENPEDELVDSDLNAFLWWDNDSIAKYFDYDTWEDFIKFKEASV